MQLVLELLKKIFVALSGIYTKQESDAQLAVKADKAEVEAEATARQEADEALEAKIEANTANANGLANVVKWQSYAAAMQSMVDETTAAQIAEEFERATNEYLADPKATKQWNTTSATESTNPYYLVPPTKPVVDFNVVNAKGINTGYPSFSKQTKQVIFLSNIKSGYSLLRSNSTSGAPLFVLCTDSTYLIGGSVAWTAKIFAPATTQAYGLCQNCLLFNHAVYLPNLSSGSAAFRNTKMSAENIAKTLDSLPTWTYGNTHVITFTGSPGCAELTQESPSVAAAVAKGWTVEL